jgi:hypothetical protein
VTSGTYSEATRTFDISAITGKAITNGMNGFSALTPSSSFTGAEVHESSANDGRIRIGVFNGGSYSLAGIWANTTQTGASYAAFAQDSNDNLYFSSPVGNGSAYLYFGFAGSYWPMYLSPTKLTLSIPIVATIGQFSSSVNIGPTISGKQAHIFTDGTNCFFVNVNSVTNAAGSGSVPYTDWTGTVTPQNGTATVAYAHGNMPVLVVPNGGGTTRVTVATGTYAATSGVSRVSLSIWAGTNTIELVTNEVDYATAPDIPTNGWGTILFRRVSDGRWKGVGL